MGTAKVFVYGTLKLGFGNSQFLFRSIYIGEDRIAGAMYDYGAFPVACLHHTGKIQGQLFQIDKATLEELDRLEGYPTFYNRMEVETDGGHKAWVYYQLPAQIEGLLKIEDGIWRKKE